MTKKINERLKDIVVEQLGVSHDEIKNTSDFANDLGADSLDFVETIMVVEEEFGIEISDEKAEKLTTFGELLEFVINANANK